MPSSAYAGSWEVLTTRFFRRRCLSSKGSSSGSFVGMRCSNAGGATLGSGAHVRVAEVGVGGQVLLDEPAAHPTLECQRGADLVVGARGPGACELLPADGHAGRL